MTMMAPSRSSISTARSRKWTSRTGTRSGKTARSSPPRLPRTGAARSTSKARTRSPAAATRSPRTARCAPAARSTASTCSNDPRRRLGRRSPAPLRCRIGLCQCADVHLVRDQHAAAAHRERHGRERAPGTGTGQAVAVALLEHRAVRGAHDERAVGSQEAVRQQVQRVAGVRAAVDVAAHPVPDAHHHPTQRPVARADGEAARGTGRELTQTAYHALEIEGLGRHRTNGPAHAGASCCLSSATMWAREYHTITSPGSPNAKLTTKYANHPAWSAMRPAGYPRLYVAGRQALRAARTGRR